MKKVIEGRIYNTDTAKAIATGERINGSFSDYRETLYLTKKGRFFLEGEGGPMTSWAKPSGNNGWQGGSGIVPMAHHDALEWLECHGDAEIIEQHFELEDA